MKSRLLYALVAAVLCPLLSATTTVTGNIKTLGTTVANKSFVRFWLRGCKGNQPRVSGVAIFPANVNGQFYFDIPTDASGTVSGTLYSTRAANGIDSGEIECGGSRVAVYYGMQVFRNSVGGPEVPVHAKNTAILDVSTVTPITTSSVVAAPTGDTTYARIDGGNQPFLGGIQAASVTTSGAITAASVAAASVSAGYLTANGWAVPVENFGAVGDWNGTTGTDNTAAIQNCLNSLTSGSCLLQAKSYKITGPLTITKSNVGIVGTVPVLVNTGLFPTPSSSVIVSTSTSADIIDVVGSGMLANNVFKNFTVQRSVAPTGTAKGLSLVNSYAAVVDAVTCADSIYCFYFRGVGSLGFGKIENSAAQWGYNGFTESSGSLYGFYVDTSAGLFSPSIRLRNNFVASNGVAATTYGFANVGTLVADWHLFHNETAGLNYGIYLNNSGVGYTASSDIQIIDPIMDACVTACIYVTGLTGTVSITGGWVQPTGANSVAADFESGSSGSQISMVGTTVYGAQITASSGVVIGRNSYNVQVIGNKIRTDSSSVPPIFFSGVTAGVISGNNIWSTAGTTTLVSLVNTINVPISSNVLNGNSTNGIVLDANTHGISGLETNTCGASIAVITNCLVDSGVNPSPFVTGTQIAPVAFSSIPACSAGLEGLSRAVNNSNTATYNATVAGGGTNHIIAYCNGTNWVAH